MRADTLPSIRELYGSLEAAAVDLYGFSLVCHSGAAWLAEPVLLDSLLLGLERFWFTEDDGGTISHREFREEFYRSIWQKGLKGEQHVQEGVDVPLGHGEMRFYRLPRFARAALYLRTKKNFNYATIALILEVPESRVKDEVEKAREFLLGRRLRELEWAEEDF